MSTLWSHIHSQLDHGQSMSFTVTKTGIEGELMITLHLGKQNGQVEMFPPPIFRNNCKILDQTFEEEFRKLPIQEGMDCIRNASEFAGAVAAVSAMMKALSETKNVARRQQRAKDTKKLADAQFRLGNYDEALKGYILLNDIKPDEYAAIRIEACLGFIARENSKETPEEILTDPFPPEQGFGKTEK